jgi:hypothetical protein
MAKDKRNTTKRTKLTMLWWPTSQTLKWSDTMKSGGGRNIYKINNSRDNFSPELRRNRGGKQQSSSDLKKVTMLTVSNTVLSVSTGASVLRKSALLIKKVMKRTG